ncbi:unnamed protein product [Ectocarpus sp. 12 AP-2014]
MAGGGQNLRTILSGSEAAIFDLIFDTTSIQQWAEWLQTPLEHAVAEGDMDLVVKLAQAGARGIAVHLAVRQGHEAVAAELLRLGASPNEPDESGDTPLHIATSQGYDSILALLLLQKAGVDVLDGKGRTPLHLAAECGSLAAVEALVSANADLTLRFGDEDRSAMDCAVCFGHVEIMRALIQHGVSVNDAGASGMTPLHIAADRALLPAIQMLVEAGANVGAEEQGKCTPLHLAARSASADAVVALLRQGADTNKLNGDGLSSLHMAAKDNAAATVHALLAGGAQPNLRASKDDNAGLTALHMAVSNKNAGVIDALVEAGADVDVQGGETCETPLHLGTKLGSSEAVASLLKLEADANKLNDGQYSALHLAAESGSATIVHVLLATGAQPNLRGGEDRKTALDLAAVGGHVEAATALVQHRASLNATDKLGRAALHSAASNNHVAVIDVLVAAGARFDVRDQQGLTPLHAASDEGCAEAIATLMKHGAGGNHVNADGESPLHLAVRRDDVAAATALLVGGANPNLDSKDDVFSPLYLATVMGHLHVLKVFLQHGADVNRFRTAGATLLHTAANEKDVGVVEALIAAGADLEAEDTDGGTPLHQALRSGSSEVVQALLKHGADQTKRTSRNRGLLHEAAEGGSVSCVEALLAGGADIALRDEAGRTALHVAALHSGRVVEKLLHYGADTESRDTSNRTALHEAAMSSDGYLSINALVDGGAAIEARDDDGRTPLHLASASHSCTDMKALLRSGADIRARDKNGRSPLHLAVREGYYVTDVRSPVDLLLRWGADETAKDDGDQDDDDDDDDGPSVGNSPAELWEYRVKVTCSTYADAAPVQKLLDGARKDRTWRRRGWLVMCRAFPDKVRLRADSGGSNAKPGRDVRVRGDSAAGSDGVLAVTKHGRAAGGLNDVVARSLGFEGGVFRNIVTFL